MTLSRVDLHTPESLHTGYLEALDREVLEIRSEIEQHRTEWVLLEDRLQTLGKLRRDHVAALQALNPPTATPASLHELVDQEAQADSA